MLARSSKLAARSSQLPPYSDFGNLVAFPHLLHTRFTYHRTWETGLEAEIRVAAFSPAFFCSRPHPVTTSTPPARIQIN